MVEHQPSKLDTWVRFPSPAFYYAQETGKARLTDLPDSLADSDQFLTP